MHFILSGDHCIYRSVLCISCYVCVDSVDMILFTSGLRKTQVKVIALNVTGSINNGTQIPPLSHLPPALITPGYYSVNITLSMQTVEPQTHFAWYRIRGTERRGLHLDVDIFLAVFRTKYFFSFYSGPYGSVYYEKIVAFISPCNIKHSRCTCNNGFILYMYYTVVNRFLFRFSIVLNLQKTNNDRLKKRPF